MKDKDELGEDLCNYCPLAEDLRGVHAPPVGSCEGSRCDEAFQTYMTGLDSKWNDHEGWMQGCFIDKPKYDWAPDNLKEDWRKEELHKVRPSPEGNAICFCPNSEDAKWIAERLNLAAKLEKRSKDAS
jgi:hypothetical protein